MNMQITLTPELKEKVEREAGARGMTVPDFVCESLERAVAKNRADDPLFADKAVFRDNGPADVAAKHDDYLYGDAS
jgi:hypothetical protein